jgi:hypothetical protein
MDLDSRPAAALDFSVASAISTSLSSSLESDSDPELESESDESPDSGFFTGAAAGLPLTTFVGGAGFTSSSSDESDSELSFESSLDAGGLGGETLFEGASLAFSVASLSSESESRLSPFFLPCPTRAGLICAALGFSASDSLSELEDESESLDSSLAAEATVAFVGATLVDYGSVSSDVSKRGSDDSLKRLCRSPWAQQLSLNPSPSHSRNPTQNSRSRLSLSRWIAPCWGGK